MSNSALCGLGTEQVHSYNLCVREVRFGVIGCGLMGREFASAAARWMHLLEMPAKPVLVGVCDPNEAAMEWFRAHIPTLEFATTRHEELLARDIDAVYVAVPHHLHEAIYIDCIRSGRHLMAEKPFGIDLGAAERIHAVALANPSVLVRCSSEFPYYPAVKRIAEMAAREEFGEVIEVRAAFLHSSDLDPGKPINWKRRVATNGEYGCMGDLGLHVCHMPFRFGWAPVNVRALLSNIVRERPNAEGVMEPCDTWDNATLACESDQGFPMVLETKRISPGDLNTWTLEVLGTKASARFSTKSPKTLQVLRFEPGRPQAWQFEDVGYSGWHPAITGPIFEFGFPDAILQMWAAFVTELAGGRPGFGCATPDEALMSHRLFSAALESHRTGGTTEVARG